MWMKFKKWIFVFCIVSMTILIVWHMTFFPYASKERLAIFWSLQNNGEVIRYPLYAKATETPFRKTGELEVALHYTSLSENEKLTEHLYFSELDVRTNQIIQTISFDVTQANFREDDAVSHYEASDCTMLIPERFFIIEKLMYPEGGRSHPPRLQERQPNECDCETLLEIYDHFSEDLHACEKHFFKLDDAHLLYKTYDEKSEGLFMIWEVHSKNHNELLYYDLRSHRVISTVILPMKADAAFRMRVTGGIVLVCSRRHLVVYSIPELRQLTTLTLKYPSKHEFFTPVAVSEDLRYIAYGDEKVFLLDTSTNKIDVLDYLHSNCWDMSWIYPMPAEEKIILPSCYTLSDMVFINDTNILAAVSRRGDYYQWDADKRKRIKHAILDIIP